jgi:hypothetical protein
MVALDQDIVISTLDIVSPLFHCLDNLQELPIVHVVVLFSGQVLPGVDIDWAKNPDSVILVNDIGDCEAACSGLQIDRFFRVTMLQPWYIDKGLVELLNCEFGILSPFTLP